MLLLPQLQTQTSQWRRCWCCPSDRRHLTLLWTKCLPLCKGNRIGIATHIFTIKKKKKKVLQHTCSHTQNYICALASCFASRCLLLLCLFFCVGQKELHNASVTHPGCCCGMRALTSPTLPQTPPGGGKPCAAEPSACGWTLRWWRPEHTNNQRNLTPNNVKICLNFGRDNRVLRRTR